MGTSGYKLEDGLGRTTFLFFEWSSWLGPLTLALSPEDGGERTGGSHQCATALIITDEQRCQNRHCNLIIAWRYFASRRTLGAFVAVHIFHRCNDCFYVIHLELRLMPE